jgi:hypothetical protein
MRVCVRCLSRMFCCSSVAPSVVLFALAIFTPWQFWTTRATKLPPTPPPQPHPTVTNTIVACGDAFDAATSACAGLQCPFKRNSNYSTSLLFGRTLPTFDLGCHQSTQTRADTCPLPVTWAYYHRVSLSIHMCMPYKATLVAAQTDYGSHAVCTMRSQRETLLGMQRA